jgi:2-C-methyl-D-erythritol 4-phosphate cytidylyltransferase
MRPAGSGPRGPVWAIVVAAGRGARYGGAKQYELIGGRTVLDRSVGAGRAACDGVVVVVAAEEVRRSVEGADKVVAGGATRSASVRAGLAAVPDAAAVVVVHDAARPLAAPALWQAAIEAVFAGADAALCAVAVTDTIKRVSGDKVAGTVDRADLVAVQTPQAFRAAALRAAHATGGDATDDGALVEAAGGRVVVVPGSAINLKITHPHDLAVAEALLEAGR